MAYTGPVSDHFDGKKFYYPYKKMNKPFSDVLKFLLNRPDSMWPKWVDGTAKDTPPQRVTGNTMRVSFVNHSTVLIQTQGKNILTDPVWSERASPVSFSGPKRAHAPGIDFEQLPPIDVVVISHNHYDHLDLKTVQRLHNKFKPTFFVGLGVSENMRSTVPDATIIELDWHQHHAIDKSLTVHFALANIGQPGEFLTAMKPYGVPLSWKPLAATSILQEIQATAPISSKPKNSLADSDWH